MSVLCIVYSVMIPLQSLIHNNYQLNNWYLQVSIGCWLIGNWNFVTTVVSVDPWLSEWTGTSPVSCSVSVYGVQSEVCTSMKILELSKNFHEVC